jgi:hypothetical protein
VYGWGRDGLAVIVARRCEHHVVVGTITFAPVSQMTDEMVVATLRAGGELVTCDELVARLDLFERLGEEPVEVPASVRASWRRAAMRLSKLQGACQQDGRP